MIIKSIRIRFLGVIAILFVGSALGASTVLQGIIKDVNGHPIAGADVRVETTNSGRLLTTVKTDASGHYSLEGLPAGNYRVTLVVNGVVKASINNTMVTSNESTQLNFALTQARASVTTKKGKHWVWVSAFTGSRLPGRWIEVDDNGSWAGEASINNVVRVSAEEMERTIHSRDIKRGF